VEVEKSAPTKKYGEGLRSERSNVRSIGENHAHKIQKELVEALAALKQEQDKLLASNPELARAHQTWVTYSDWRNFMSVEHSSALAWWDRQKDPRVLEAMRKATHDLLIKEIKLTLEDPNSRDWVKQWIESGFNKSASGLKLRQEWWNSDFTTLPNFMIPPPPEIVDPIMKGESQAGTGSNPVDPAGLIDPTVVEYLTGSAKAGVLTEAAKSYYDKYKGSKIEHLEQVVEDLNYHANRLDEK
jgi:hypothetical protein